MPFQATVLQVMIASPADTDEQREAILHAAAKWNGRHARARGYIISPWVYTMHSTPRNGDRAQALINEQGVDSSDVVVVIFGNKLGSPTGVEISGTVEEMRRGQEQGKDVHVFFSSAAVPQDKLGDAVALSEFRATYEEAQLGQYATYEDARDLGLKVIDALEDDLDRFTNAVAPPPSEGVRLRITHMTCPVAPGRPTFTNYGSYGIFTQMAVRDARERTTRKELQITNMGKVDADELQVKVVPPPGITLDMPDGGLDDWTQPRSLTTDSTFVIPCSVKGARINVDVMTRWVENQQLHQKTMTTQIS